MPRTVEPHRLANQSITLEGIIEAEQCQRLLDSVLEIKEPLRVSLQFELAEQGRKTVSGEAIALVSVTCQRCLGPLPLLLKASISLGITRTEEQAKNLPREIDPWVVEEETGDIIALVEDELLLALPIMSYHDEEECSGISRYSTGEVEAADSESPFGILEQLKKH